MIKETEFKSKSGTEKPPKNIEKYTPEDGLEDDFPLPGGPYSQVAAVNLKGGDPGVINVPIHVIIQNFQKVGLLDLGRNMVNHQNGLQTNSLFLNF